MIRRFIARFSRERSGKVFVRLLFADDSPPVLVGPMDRFSAEIFLAHRMAQRPFYGERQVASARIIGA